MNGMAVMKESNIVKRPLDPSMPEMPVVGVSAQVQRVNLLNPHHEPSDAALASIMQSVQRAARVKSEQANRALFAQLQREIRAALSRNRIGKTV